MPLSDVDAQNRIKRMMDIIDDEGNDEAEKLYAKAEEDFNLEKDRLLQQQRVKIMEYYNKKEKQVELRKKIQISTLHNQSRLRILKAREDHLKEVLEEARMKIAEVTTDKTRYKTVLEGLIAQGLCQLLETEVIIRCCKQDIDIVQEAISGAIANYQKLSKGKEVKVTIDTENFLGPDVSGGVELVAQGSKYFVQNTLESRLSLVSQQMVPELRSILFGNNANRKFYD
ncbi:hypothetical protein CHS0354_027945 [Potamilus streckersoni]|uniref:Vacuolar ATP synthase subunit E n=1 Tax=Potamilus streckersoni TaxID=2493646 RepID=A0AAE0T4V7_9BIVA|nr:hypothetical protein CHS0354_027945 [Potamilus streckersoni]